MKNKLKILDNDYEIKIVSPLQVWEQNKGIIYSLIYSNFSTLQHFTEDIEQTCFLKFWKVYKIYDYNKGVIIGKWLKKVFYNEILKIWQKEKTCLYNTDIEQVDIIKNVDIHNWKVENMEFSKLLTQEQISILQYILEGYEYKEIYDLLLLKGKTKEKARLIYRRVAKIKEIIAKFYSMNYVVPRVY